MSLPWDQIAKLARDREEFIEIQRERVYMLKSFGLAKSFDFDKAVSDSYQEAISSIHDFESLLESRIDNLYLEMK